MWGPVRLIFVLGQRREPGVYADAWFCSYRAPDGTTVEIDVRERPGESGRVLELLRQRVADASIEDGVLSLRFENGAEFHARPDEQYENWTLEGGGRTLFSVPGGDVVSS